MAIKQLLTALCLAGVAVATCAQTAVDPAKAEVGIPPPPTYSRDKLIPIEMPPYVTLKVGIDPDTVTVGSDDVVRYVVVMRNTSGSVSAAFEGIQCASGEVKTYARAGTSGAWTTVEPQQWRNLTDNLPSKHAYALSKQGVCDGRTAAKRADILNTLKRGKPSYQ